MIGRQSLGPELARGLGLGRRGRVGKLATNRRGQECLRRGQRGAEAGVERQQPEEPEPQSTEALPGNWPARVSELSAEAVEILWSEAIGYARWEIGAYAIWREQDGPVLADGYDAEGLVQSAFGQLLAREKCSAPARYTAVEIQRELRKLIKHRVRWLHERSERRLVVGGGDVLPPRPNGDLLSIFKYLPGAIESGSEEALAKEKEEVLSEFRAGFEQSLGKQKQLREVFRGMWDGQKRREIARRIGVGVEEVKALQEQVKRRLKTFAAEAGERVAEGLGVRSAERGIQRREREKEIPHAKGAEDRKELGKVRGVGWCR
jgi:hypothetical protein